MATVFRSRNFVLISLANLLIFLAFQMIVPILPLYVEMMGGNDLIAGLVVSMGTIGGLLVRPITGRLIDRKGRMTFYYITLVACAASVAMYPFCTVLLFLPIVRSLHGAFMGGYTTVASTVVADILPRFQLNEGMGYYACASTLALAISPAVGLTLVTILDFQSVFLLALGLVLLTIVVSLFMKLPPVKLNSPAKHQSPYERQALLPGVLLFFGTMAYCAPATYLALYCKELGSGNAGPLFTVYAGSIILSRLLFGRIPDRHGSHMVLLPSLALAPISFIFLVCGTEYWLFAIAAMLYGFSFGITLPTCQALAVKNMRPERRGAANATAMSGFDLGFVIGAPLWGFVAHFWGYRVMFGAISAMLVIPFVIYVIYYCYCRNNGNGHI